MLFHTIATPDASSSASFDSGSGRSSISSISTAESFSSATQEALSNASATVGIMSTQPDILAMILVLALPHDDAETSEEQRLANTQRYTRRPVILSKEQAIARHSSAQDASSPSPARLLTSTAAHRPEVAIDGGLSPASSENVRENVSALGWPGNVPTGSQKVPELSSAWPESFRETISVYSITFCNIPLSTSVNHLAQQSLVSLDWILSSGISASRSLVSGVLTLPSGNSVCSMHIKLGVTTGLPYDLALGRDWLFFCRQTLPHASFVLSSGVVQSGQPRSSLAASSDSNRTAMDVDDQASVRDVMETLAPDRLRILDRGDDRPWNPPVPAMPERRSPFTRATITQQQLLSRRRISFVYSRALWSAHLFS
ncbi:hypothetical protein FB451DRAFT_1180378 [Mycena latifolia]|nr:hypothetical protein FB451DRAFT_1180378 [Mycena latifolia]